jgi:hypothetical protein
MIYIHHVPQHDAADKLSRLLSDRSSEQSGCTQGARELDERDPDDAESDVLQGLRDAGGETRTPDTRIMI